MQQPSLLQLYDKERRNIARELHDKTAQNLAALSMNLTILAGAIGDKERAGAILDECNALTEECLKEVRTLSYTLYPALLDELGLLAALRTFLEMYRRSTSVSVELRAGPVPRFAREVELAAFQVAREALLNVHAHSRSERAELAVIISDSSIEVRVRDWGKGLAPRPQRRKGFGFTEMRERMRLLGGTLKIESVKPGTRVSAVLPLGARTCRTVS